MARERKGSIVERNGRIYARVQFISSDGQKRDVWRKADNRKHAREIIRQLLNEIDEQGTKAIDVARMTVSDLCNFYCQHYLKPAEYVDNRKIAGLRSAKVVAGYISIIKNHFGKRLLRSITHGDLRTFRAIRLQTNTWQNKPRTIATVNRELAYLRRLLNIANCEGWINRNPFKAGDALIHSSDERKHERILTRNEESLLLSVCTGKRAHLRAIIICALDTGMRRGEVLKLRWRDVNFTERVITIQAFNTKTMKERQVSITTRLALELEKLCQQSTRNEDDLVFGIMNTFKTAFYGAIKDAGLNGLRFHDLRHCAATRLVQGHIPLQMVGRILGHTQPTTTYRYVNANLEMMRHAAEALDAFNEQKLDEAAGMIN